LTFIRRQHVGSGSQETRTRHYAPETNGAVERLKRSPGVRALYRCELANAAELAEEVASGLRFHDEVRPHEALGQRIPLVVQCKDEHQFWTSSVQGS